MNKAVIKTFSYRFLYNKGSQSVIHLGKYLRVRLLGQKVKCDHIKDREAWRAAVHGVSKRQTQLST